VPFAGTVDMTKYSSLCAVILTLSSFGWAQCQMEAVGGNRCFLSSVGKPVTYGAVENPSMVSTGASSTQVQAGQVSCQQALIGTGAVIGGAVTMGAVSSSARGVAHSVGHVRDIPIYGSALPKLGFIGRATGAVAVPTTLGEVPFLGSTVSKVPLVGPVIAGPPNPIIVGAVAVDSFVLPKVAPCGYTESSMFTMTDFNSPPRLRHYVNYLAPLPYTHPPIYSPAAPEANVLPWEIREQMAERTVSIEQ
jgi:hypothetical protein